MPIATKSLVVNARLIYLLRFIVPILVLWLVFQLLDIELNWYDVRQLNWVLFGAGFLTFEIAVLLRIWRWHALTHNVNIGTSWRHSAIVFRIGWFTGAFLPQGWGSMSKVLYHKHDNARIPLTSCCVISERLLDLLNLVMFGIAGAAYLTPDFVRTPTSWDIDMTIVLGAVATIAAIALITSLQRKRIQGISERIGLVDALREISQMGKRFAIFLLSLSTVIWLTHVLSVYFILLSLSPAIPWDKAIAGFALCGFATLFPLTLDGVGIREASLAAIFVGVGYSGETGVAWGALISLECLLSRLLGAPLMVWFPPKIPVANKQAR